MQISFASLFTADAVGASFDASIEAQAMAGRVPAMFIEAVATHYAVTLPASPKAAVIAINHMAALSTPLQVVKGAGARSSAATLMQALYRVGELLQASPAKGLPALSALPAWADPVALQAEKDKRKAAKAAKNKAPVTPEEGEEGEPTASESKHDAAVPVDMAQQIATALALVQAAAKSGQLTQAQWDIIRALADTSAPVAAPSKATVEERVAQQAADALQAAKTPKAPKAPKASKAKPEAVTA